MPSNRENFKKYLNNHFIETGSYLGDGIQQAIDSGYQNIVSIELADKYFDYCTKRFINNTNIKIIKGDSFKVLPSILNEIKEPITFWLDGHHSCGDTGLGKYWAPLMQELEVIKTHPVKTHTIMIDDMRCWELPNPVHGFYKDDIIKILLEINKDYIFTYENGLVENDILIAHVKNTA